MKYEKVVMINLSPKTLWEVLTEAKYTKDYMFNCEVKSDWKKGSSIIWKGNYEGYEAYQKGEILEIEPCQILKYSTFDPNYGLEDRPENYIHVSYLIEEVSKGTELAIIKETFVGDAKRMEHIESGWEMVIPRLKKVAKEAGVGFWKAGKF